MVDHIGWLGWDGLLLFDRVRRERILSTALFADDAEVVHGGNGVSCVVVGPNARGRGTARAFVGDERRRGLRPI